MKTRLMLVEPEVARRLEAVAALASRYDVIPVGEGEDPLRVARARRPDVAVLSVQARRPDAALRLCRTLRTDVRPVARVAIVDRTGDPGPGAEALAHWMADGYLGGAVPVADLVAFVEAVCRGERPVRRDAAPQGRGLVGRVLARLKRGGA